MYLVFFLGFREVSACYKVMVLSDLYFLRFLIGCRPCSDFTNGTLAHYPRLAFVIVCVAFGGLLEGKRRRGTRAKYIYIQ